MSRSGSDRLSRLVDLGDDLVARARRAGADVAEVALSEGSHLSAKVRMRETKLVEEAGSRGLGLRVMLGQQVATAYTSDLSADGVARLVEDALELARLSQPDPFAGPPDAAELWDGGAPPALELVDPSMNDVDAREAIDAARAGEAAALAFDPRITNSEGATFSRALGASALVTSGGFRGAHEGSYASLVVRPVADDADGKKRAGHHWTAKRHRAELDAPEAVGAEAARRTLRQLGARKAETCEVPVIFDPDAARGILGLLASSVNGGAVWRRASYLLDRLETLVASACVTIVDDPLIPRGPGSRPFDGEGLRSRRTSVVEAGTLRSYLLDTYAARKLGHPSGTASASRGASGGVSPSPSNFVLLPGTMAETDLIRATKRGLYVTETMGFGFNAVTGDFSRGASGFWIEGGELAYPVSETTISLNLDELWKRVDGVARELDLRTSIASPAFRVSAMTVAGR